MSPPVFLRRHKIRVGAVKPKTFVPMLKHFRAIEGEQIMIEITACLGQAARLGVDPVRHVVRPSFPDAFLRVEAIPILTENAYDVGRSGQSH